MTNTIVLRANCKHWHVIQAQAESVRNYIARLQSFPIGNYAVFYQEIESGIDVIRVLYRSRDIQKIFRQGYPPDGAKDQRLLFLDMLVLLHLGMRVQPARW